MKLRLKLSLPLLAKELIERAARKRTYVLRVLFAALLYAAFFAVFSSEFQASGAQLMGRIGRGRALGDRRGAVAHQRAARPRGC